MKQVLIVEDDAEVRRLLSELLEELGAETHVARDGLQAVQYLREHELDLVIVDLMMPRLDGYSVIRYLEEQRPETRAIVISGVRLEELQLIGRSPVVEAVFGKPLDAAALAEGIPRALGVAK